MEEVKEYQLITEQERFREKMKIIDKHRQMDETLLSKYPTLICLGKRDSYDRQQKALQVDNKMQKLLEYYEKQLEKDKEIQLRK